MIVSVVMIGALKCVGSVIRGRMRTSDASFADQLANQLLAEIVEQQYLEPIDPPVFGLEASESSGVRTDWDDVDDYHLWSSNPPEDRKGVPLTNSSGWARSVVVEWVDPANPSVAVGSDQGVKRITVTVQRNGEVVAQQIGLRSDQYTGTSP